MLLVRACWTGSQSRPAVPSLAGGPVRAPRALSARTHPPAPRSPGGHVLARLAGPPARAAMSAMNTPMPDSEPARYFSLSRARRMLNSCRCGYTHPRPSTHRRLVPGGECTASAGRTARRSGAARRGRAAEGAFGVVQRRDVGHRAVRGHVHLERPAGGRRYVRRPVLVARHHPVPAARSAASTSAYRLPPPVPLGVPAGGGEHSAAVRGGTNGCHRSAPCGGGAGSPRSPRPGSRTGRPAPLRATRRGRRSGRRARRARSAPGAGRGSANEAWWSSVKRPPRHRPRPGRTGVSGVISAGSSAAAGSAAGSGSRRRPRRSRTRGSR